MIAWISIMMLISTATPLQVCLYEQRIKLGFRGEKKKEKKKQTNKKNA